MPNITTVAGFLEDGIHAALVDAFKPVLILMPRAPTDPRYREFLETTLEYSVSKFNLTKPPFGAVLVRNFNNGASFVFGFQESLICNNMCESLYWLVVQVFFFDGYWNECFVIWFSYLCIDMSIVTAHFVAPAQFVAGDKLYLRWRHISSPPCTIWRMATKCAAVVHMVSGRQNVPSKSAYFVVPYGMDFNIDSDIYLLNMKEAIYYILWYVYIIFITYLHLH